MNITLSPRQVAALVVVGILLVASLVLGGVIGHGWASSSAEADYKVKQVELEESYREALVTCEESFSQDCEMPADKDDKKNADKKNEEDQ